ncbi:pentatricopeptide repeat-containing protein At5g40410, mitochondrial isoform X2 [Ricinus communis]|uniref:pentatricopeptide repeat-containing protein At5g40410, mitochondrial isoform X2 n=1 Tax=Ricinus communis TaxID=3988 RepID=UPI00077294B9|nr:pentatricopeptide repeat-containing protein At5g40410, mitochondrial isoform X2 [Ricinus communis]|eukprot:XP_015574134.1 pentatricopeptide repeat-containing protein At5g40410, mitochondrial [Ricinus communis]
MSISQKILQPLPLFKFIISRIITFHNAFPFQSSLQFHTCPNLDTLVSALISSIASCNSISYCGVLHSRVIKSLSYNHGFVGDQFVSAYVRLGCTKDAQNLFDELPEKDLVSWNSLISGFSRRGDLDNCLNVFSKMKYQTILKPNEVTFISLISACTDAGALGMGKYVHGFAVKLGTILEVKVVNALICLYGKSGCLDAACRIFEEMQVQNLVSWNSIIAVHVQRGFAQDGLRYFIVMRRAGIVSDQATLVILLQACESVGLRKLVEAIHGYIFGCGLNMNLAVETALLKLYANLGMLSASHKVFREMVNKDAVAWTAMLACYAVHGCGKEAIELFELMVREGAVPDHVTFTHLLSACSHSGLVKEGKYYFKVMSEVYRVEPRVDHYSCMVDLLGRSGLLDDAYKLIKSMQIQPNSAVWGALIGACRIYGNIELGKEVAEKLCVLDPSDSRNYIMLSNMLSASRQWKDASKVRALMRERNLTRNPGCSFIEHGNRIRRFVTFDQSHPETKQIYNKLDALMRRIREAGYTPKTEFVLHDVGEDVKEDLISKHSEKLAIAFGILVTNANVPLIITKNLRICGDCHSTAKFISLIEKRTIIIRDTKRFHHFANGTCSCRDYW